MSFKALLIVALTATSLTSCEALLLGGKCSTVEYMMAYESCLGEYLRGMIDVIPNGIGSLDAIRKYHFKTCDDGLITNTIKCFKRVDDMCDYSLVSTSFLTGVTKILCDRHAVIEEMKKCTFNITDLITCAKSITINTKNPICSYVDKYIRQTYLYLLLCELKRCLNIFVSPCTANVMKFISDLIDQFSAGRCNNGVQTSGKCTMMSYLISATGCYASFGAKLPDVIQENTKLNFNTSQQLAAVCKMSSLNRGFACHHEVDERCTKSLVNAKKMQLAWNSVCSNVDDIVKISSCFDANNYKKALKCLMDKTEQATDPCTLIMGVKSCIKDLFTKCPAGIMSFLDKTYAITVPSTCDNTISKTKCSHMSYLSGMALCWGPSVIGAVDKILGSNVDLGQTSCAASVLDRGKACHEKLNKKCDESMVRAKDVGIVLQLMCSDEKVFSRFPACLKGVNATFYTDCTDLDIRPNGVKNTRELCGLIGTMRGCLMKPFMGQACHASVPKLMNAVMDAAKPAWCPDVQAHATSIQQSVFFVSFIAVLFRVLFQY